MTAIAQNIFGKINPPPGVIKFSPNGELSGLSVFINNILKFAIVIAGVYTVFNILFAGYAFYTAGDDPKKVGAAWGKIWQSLLGLAVVAGSFVLAAIFGELLFNDPNALLQIKLFTP